MHTLSSARRTARALVVACLSCMISASALAIDGNGVRILSSNRTLHSELDATSAIWLQHPAFCYWYCDPISSETTHFQADDASPGLGGWYGAIDLAPEHPQNENSQSSRISARSIQAQASQVTGGGSAHEERPEGLWLYSETASASNHFDVTFEIDEAISFALRGELAATYSWGTSVTRVRLTGPAGVVAELEHAGWEYGVECDFPDRPVPPVECLEPESFDFAGVLQPGVYDLELVAFGSGGGFVHHSGVDFSGGHYALYSATLEFADATLVPGGSWVQLLGLASFLSASGARFIRRRPRH